MNWYLLAVLAASILYYFYHILRKTQATPHGCWIVPLLAVPLLILGMIAGFFICAASPECSATITMP